MSSSSQNLAETSTTTPGAKQSIKCAGVGNGHEKWTVAATKANGIAIRVKNLSKSFHRPSVSEGYSSIKSLLLNLWRSRAPKVHFQALQDISFSIHKGESVGIIGSNGSGKSTLLKILTGIYRPDEGEVFTCGQINSLIELGAGFHPDFTGRENIMLGGVLMGMNKQELNRRFDEIVAFSELSNVIDCPIRTYSSGMYMRLGFSLAVHSDPEILLIDEVLAVGDAKFEAKCRDRLLEMKRQGLTFILVSHDLGSIERWCDRAIWLNRGVMGAIGTPVYVIGSYREALKKEEEVEQLLKAKANSQFEEPEFSQDSRAKDELEDDCPKLGSELQERLRWGDWRVKIVDCQIIRDGEARLVLGSEESFTIMVRAEVHDAVSDIGMGIAINRSDDTLIMGTNTFIESNAEFNNGITGIAQREFIAEVNFPHGLQVVSGSYYLDIAFHDSAGNSYDYIRKILEFTIREARQYHGLVCSHHTFSLKPSPNSRS